MITFSIIGPAFIAGLLFLLIHIPLGREVLRRGIIFVDLAIAQVAAASLVFANILGFPTDSFASQSITFIGAIIAASCLSLTRHYSVKQQEAIIGIIFVMSATASMLLLTRDVHAAQAIEHILAGQILWVQWSNLITPCLLSLLIVFCYLKKSYVFQTPIFYLFFAVAITLAVQQIGIYLVFANLIIPALTTQGFTKRNALLFGMCLGGVAYALGLVISAFFDLPSGPMIVWCLAGCAVLCRIIVNRPNLTRQVEKI